MAIRCEDVTARLLELLYEELPEGERAPLAAHIEGCPRCKAELAAFAETRAVARRVLDDAPPARAHAAILQAAAAHAATAKPSLAAASPAAAAPAARKPRATAAEGSFWDRLRARWALPTLATVGAIAVFLLASKLLLEPNKAYQVGKEAMQPTPVAEAPAGAPVEGPGKAPPVMQEKSAPADQEKQANQARPRGALDPFAASPSRAEEKDRDDRKLRPVTIGESHGVAANAEGKAKKNAAHKRAAAATGDALGEGPAGGGSVGGLGSAGEGRSAAKGSVEDLLDGATTSERHRFAPPPPAREAAPKAGAARPKREAAAEPEYAPAPPAPAPKAKSDSAESAPPRVAADESPMAAESEEAPVARMQAKAKRSDDKMAEKKSAPQPAPVAATPSVVPYSSKPSVAARAPDPLVQRADRLFELGQWAEAAATYRQLINRDPRNADAARWRQRLVLADRQVAAAEAARAAKVAPAKAAPATAAPPR